jgi:polyhydroxyalkanoate synthesis regulator phasin
MPRRNRWRVVASVALMVLAPAIPAQEGDPGRQSMEELRNTVINLLHTLVERGVITREQAEAMVKSAQEKAAKAAAEVAQQQKSEEGAVRVPYVPEIVKDQIKQDIEAQIAPNVRQEVANQLGSQGTIFSALPGWMQRMTLSGDVRVRGEGDEFASDNATNAYLNYNQINLAGGVSKAGPLALLNTTRDQERLRLRIRLGLDADLGSGWTAAVKLATGSTGEVVATTNQTLGTYGAGYTVTFDQGYLRWTGDWSEGDQVFTAYAGRFASPWVGTDLVWYNDLTFEGVVSNYRINFADDSEHRKEAFITVAAMPLSSFSPFDNEPTNEQKWLLGGQLGGDLRFEDESRLRFAAAYYDYIHIVGRGNTLDSTLNNWSAPAFVQKGNTLFDIANTSDTTVNLFALASNYRILDLISMGDLRVSSRYSLGLTLEALRNFGFNVQQVEERVGNYVAPRTKGYRADVSFGTSTPPMFGNWRATLGYRYLQRDATLDAFNDEDFHLGGTDAKGYTVMFDFNFTPHVWMRAKYMSANAIDGPPLGIDVWQLDMNAGF